MALLTPGVIHGASLSLIVTVSRGMIFHTFSQCIGEAGYHLVNRFALERCFPVDNFEIFFYHLSLWSVIFPDHPLIWRRTWYTKVYITLDDLVFTVLIRGRNYFTADKSEWVVGEDEVNTCRRATSLKLGRFIYQLFEAIGHHEVTKFLSIKSFSYFVIPG